MVSKRPFKTATSKNSEPVQSLGERVLAIAGGAACVIFALIIVRYLYPDELIQDDPGRRYILQILPSGLSGHANVLRLVALVIGVPLLLWFFGVFDRRQR
jgi:cellobiose-specific phosphotransferase system component IIC